MKIGLLSFRVAGTDGVSLEIEHWQRILSRMGHETVLIAGELDGKGILIPELHFKYPGAFNVYRLMVDEGVNCLELEKRTLVLTEIIEKRLDEAFRKEKLDRLVVCNVFSLPVHFPLVVALVKVIEKCKLSTVVRNHDFWWERDEFLNANGCMGFYKQFCPPNNKYIKQVVINKIDKKRLKERTGMDSVVVGDTFDFDSELDKMDGYSEKWREDFGILDDELVFLQATRIVSRKKIELAMDLVKKLDDKRIVLVLAGYEGDEIGNYGDCLRYYVGKLGIRTMFIADRIGSTRKLVSGKRRYTLWDCYVNCDFVTYPSILEGFGNQFLEAMYFRKPVMVNRYEVYKSDIEPLGFEVIAINGRVTEKVVVKTREWLEDKEKVKKITEKNFRIAKKYFSYEAREKQLRELGL